MPRKPNYGFDKRRKEQERKAKKDAKRLERQQRKEQGLPVDDDIVGLDQVDDVSGAEGERPPGEE